MHFIIFVSVFSEEEPDLNNELEVSVSINTILNPKIISYVCPNIFQNNLYPVIFLYIFTEKTEISFISRLLRLWNLL